MQLKFPLMNQRVFVIWSAYCALQLLIAASALADKAPEVQFQCGVSIDERSAAAATRVIPLLPCTGGRARETVYSLTGCREDSMPLGDSISLDFEGEMRLIVMHVNAWATTRSGLRGRVRFDGVSVALKDADVARPDYSILLNGGLRSSDQSFLGQQDLLVWTNGQWIGSHRMDAYCFMRLTP